MRILVVPDKFKGTLTAQQAAAAISDGWRDARPEDTLTLLPMSDGGDGFAEVFGRLLNATRRESKVVDAAHQPRTAAWWFGEQSQVAVVETAQSNGLALLPAGKFHPFELDTDGVGELLADAAASGAKVCYAGVGGSATNDGGFGMARAISWKFLDSRGAEITLWTELSRLHALVPPRKPLFQELIVANDVQNPLLGPSGASRIYGPQKGVRPEDFPKADECLGKLAEVCARELGRDYASLPGAGAAGGLGFGLVAFAGGKFKPGFELFAEVADLERKIKEADIVMSAEGAIDEQTAMGKGVGGVAELCQQLGKPCIGLAGALMVENIKSFKACYGIHPHITSPENARANAGPLLRELAARAARSI